MNNNFTRRSFLAMVILLGLGSVPAPAQTVPPPQAVRILFIGNSLTYFNDLPKMVQELAQAGQQTPLIYEKETPGGCTLEKHWKDGKALAKIQAHPWDFVVLQDYSSAPLLKRDAMFEFGRKFDAAIKKQGAKTLFYMTWALQNKPDDQAAISQAYLDLSKELQDGIAPVGKAWQAALQADPNLRLHLFDGKHPNATGTYLAACVFYATIYHVSPEGLPGKVGKLTDAQARPLQVIAWKTVQETCP